MCVRVDVVSPVRRGPADSLPVYFRRQRGQTGLSTAGHRRSITTYPRRGGGGGGVPARSPQPSVLQPTIARGPAPVGAFPHPARWMRHVRFAFSLPVINSVSFRLLLPCVLGIVLHAIRTSCEQFVVSIYLSASACDAAVMCAFDSTNSLATRRSSTSTLTGLRSAIRTFPWTYSPDITLLDNYPSFLRDLGHFPPS